MPWKECDRMSLRRELVCLARHPDANASGLAQRYGVSRKTLYKWIKRHRDLGEAGLYDRSRRPHCSPNRTADDLQARILQVRDAHPAWGGRKIHAYFSNKGHSRLPAPSTITAILHRHQRISPEASRAAQSYVRFERASSNELWQNDFKGDFALLDGGRCFPLTIVDDHSRFALCLEACSNQQWQTVRCCWEKVFRRYGLPRAMLMDNGAPWGVSHSVECYTRLEVWLMRQDVRVLHGRPFHPQTQGKEERFHRTLNVQLLQGRRFERLEEVQRAFDPWRQMYNQERPHEALGQKVPASAYLPSLRNYVEGAPATTWQFAPEDQLRRLNPVGQLQWRGHAYKLSEAFGGETVAVRAAAQDGVWRVYFGRFCMGMLDERDKSSRLVRERHCPA